MMDGHRPGFATATPALDAAEAARLRDVAAEAYAKRSERLQKAWRKEHRESAGFDHDCSPQYADAASTRRATARLAAIIADFCNNICHLRTHALQQNGA